MNYEQKLDSLINEALNKIFDLIDVSEDFSAHFSHTQCLKITVDTFMFNLEGNRYLTEITRNELVDNSGYTYSFFNLEADQLVTLSDYLIEKYKK